VTAGHQRRRTAVRQKATLYIQQNKNPGNFPNPEKELSIQVQETSKTPNRLDQNKTSPCHIIDKTTSTENRERILKSVREKKQITHKGKPIQITADFSMEYLLQEGQGVRYFEH
jgi:hypothetical protein